MEEFDLGPNGGLVYCMEYLLIHFSWLEERLKALGSQYILFDCPGQVSAIRVSSFCYLSCSSFNMDYLLFFLYGLIKRERIREIRILI
jgi:ABC-type multidrug transport system permease subunit